MATFAERVAATDAFDAHPTASAGTIFLDRLRSVLRTARRKPAMLTQKGTQYQLVGTNDGLQNLFHEWYFGDQAQLYRKKTCCQFQVGI